eukprot:gb/GECG01010940.1/.p1 GENE.gb/GECG01010940.1/~~gb/GECG01010940.1/.p1  ORF type:complete len:326 (+),score=29.09 gb/GECG01010940.1/:1-978(+)
MKRYLRPSVLPALRTLRLYSPSFSRSLTTKSPDDTTLVPPLGNPLDYVDKDEHIERLARLLEQKLEDVFPHLERGKKTIMEDSYNFWVDRIQQTTPTEEVIRSTFPKDKKAAYACIVFYFVRDAIRYDPFSFYTHYKFKWNRYSPSHILEHSKGQGAFCVPKSILFSSLLQAANIPSRIGFCLLRNHRPGKKLRDMLMTDLYFHSYATVWIDDKLAKDGGRWLKVAPIYNKEMCTRFRMIPLEFTAAEDASLHTHDTQGRPLHEVSTSRSQPSSLQRHFTFRSSLCFLQLVEDYGTFASLPPEFFRAKMYELYPQTDSLIDSMTK